jgi:hypothetical protein
MNVASINLEFGERPAGVYFVLIKNMAGVMVKRIMKH